jgi:hypothetical protein
MDLILREGYWIQFCTTLIAVISNMTIYSYSYSQLYFNEESSYFVDCNVVALPNFSVYYNGTFIRNPRKIFQAMASIPSLREAHKFYNVSVKPCVSVNSADIVKCLRFSYHLLDTRAIVSGLSKRYQKCL